MDLETGEAATAFVNNVKLCTFATFAWVYALRLNELISPIKPTTYP